MGFFSWKTSDTKKPVRNRYARGGPTPCKMLDDAGNVYVERNYEGYGMFGGMSFYALVDLMNGGSGDFGAGLELMDVNHHSKAPKGVRAPKIVSIDCEDDWYSLPDSKNDPNQGYF